MKTKKIICTLLAVILFLTGCIPDRKDASAAEIEIVSMIPYTIGGGESIIIESGKQFHAGDYMVAEMKDKTQELVSEMDMVGYVSDNPEIAAVLENGYVETKLPGTALVTVTCQGVSGILTVKVVEKGTLSAGREEMIERWETAAKKFAGKLPDKLTVKNGSAFLKAFQEYLRAFPDYTEELYAEPWEAHRMLNGWDPVVSSEEAGLLAPECRIYKKAWDMMSEYILRYHPMYQKQYWISKKQKYRMSAKPDKITFTFKKKMTEQAILALYLEEIECQLADENAALPLNFTTKPKKGRYEVSVYLDSQDNSKTAQNFMGVATIKKGSKNFTIKPTAVEKKTKKGKYKYIKKKNLKLNKGTTYRIFLPTLWGEYASEYILIK